MSEETDLEADVRAALEGGEAAAPAQAEVQEAAPQAGERPRDDHGRFAPVDKSAEVTDVAQAQPQEPARTILPPKSWTAAAKAEFASLSPSIQQEVLRREKEIDDGKAQWDSKAEQYNRLEALFEPVKDRLALSGLDNVSYIRALIHADQLLRGPNPQAAFAQVAQLYGINFPGAAPAQAQPADPALQGLQSQVQQLTQFIVGQNQQREQAERSQIEQEIGAFSQDPSHLYFENVRPDMVALLESGRAKDLAEAYTKACRMNDDVWTAINAKPITPARPAKPKDISVTGAPGNTQASRQSNPANSHEDDVRAALEELTGQI